MSANQAIVILTGGTSRRMASDKADLPFGSDHTLLGYILSQIQRDNQVLIAGPPRPYPATYLREDPPGGGPVAALAAALTRVESEYLAVLAVDTPFGASWLLHQRLSPGIDALIPCDDNGREHYLCALYRSAALRDALQVLGTANNASMKDLMNHFGDIEYVRSPSTPELSATELLLDVNTPVDLELAHSIRTRLQESM